MAEKEVAQPTPSDSLREEAGRDSLMNSYLYLHPSENPAASLVSPVLDSTNYHSWSRSVITALIAKNKVEFVMGTHPCPPKDDHTFSAWIRGNNMVASWLVHYVSLRIRQSIIWMDKVADVWNGLKTRFSQGDLSRISHLQMETELEALSTSNTWQLVSLPPGKKPIGCRWVYKIKHNSDGTIDCYKARLVAKGYTQLEGLDFLDTFALWPN